MKLLAFRYFGEGKKFGAMITKREAFNGKYPFSEENQNPNIENEIIRLN